VNKNGYIYINNIGNAKATDIIINLNQSGVIFNKVSSIPNLSKHFTFNNTSNLVNGTGIIEIDDLPAFSSTAIIVNVSKLSNVKNNNESLTIALRSDETVGKRNNMILFIFYADLLSIISVLSFSFWSGKISRIKDNVLFYSSIVIGISTWGV
jgi:hypothetical protein